MHDSPAKAGDALWGLINPDIEEDVTDQRVKEVLEKLLYYAVDLHLEYQLKAEPKNGEIEEYLRDMDDRKDRALDDVMRKLDGTVTRKEFVSAVVSIPK